MSGVSSTYFLKINTKILDCRFFMFATLRKDLRPAFPSFVQMEPFTVRGSMFVTGGTGRRET